MSALFPARARAKKPAKALGTRRKPSKYMNEPVVVNGEKFDSKREAQRYQTLVLMQSASLISGLRRQVIYDLIPAQKRADGKREAAVRYVADFVYEEGLAVVVEDLKSDPTRKLPAYIIKRKLMLHVHGITIKETK